MNLDWDELPTVSVIIPTYNRTKLLKRALNSVVDQTYPKIEIIVVDDDSNSDTKNVINFFDANIRYFSAPENKGANWCRSKGISLATGQLLAFLDDDDVWQEDKLLKQVDKYLTTSEDYQAIVGSVKHLHRKRKGEIVPVAAGQDDLLRKLLLGNNEFVTFSALLLDAELVDKIGLPDLSLSSSQDLDWFIRIALESRIAVAEGALVLYDNDPNRERITTLKFTNMVNSYEIIANKYDKQIRDFGIAFHRRARSNIHFRNARYYLSMRKFHCAIWESLKSLYYYPLNKGPYIIILSSIGGPLSYKLAKSVNRLIRW